MPQDKTTPSDMQGLARHCLAFIKLYPQHKDAAQELYGLARDEVDDGESLDNEIGLCLDALKQLTEDA